MSSNATDGAQPPAVPAGLPPESGGASAVQASTASGEAAGTGGAGSGAAGPARAGTGKPRTRAPRTAKADPGKAGPGKAGPAKAGTGGAGAAEAGPGGAVLADDAAPADDAALAEVRLDETPSAGEVAAGLATARQAAGQVSAGSTTAGSTTAGSTAAADVATANAAAMTLVLDPDLAPGEGGARDSGGIADLDEPGDPDAEPASMLAFVALITGVFALVPIAVSCAVAALIGMRRTGRHGHGMAMAALFISAAWVIIAGAIGTVGVLTHGFHKPVTIKYHEAGVFKLQAGDCVNVPNGQVVSVLPCSAPHEAEVFATFALPASGWPGTAAVRQEASSGCVSRLTGYINPQLAISLAQDYVFPDKVAWTAGTRTVICEVRATSGELTGSVRGAS